MDQGMDSNTVDSTSFRHAVELQNSQMVDRQLLVSRRELHYIEKNVCVAST